MSGGDGSFLTRVLLLPLRIIGVLPRMLLAFLLIAALGLNVMAVTSSLVFNVVSGFVESVADVTTQRKSHAQQIEALESDKSRLAQDLDAEKLRSASLDNRIGTLEVDRDRLERELAEERAGRTVMYRGQRTTVKAAVADTSERITRRVSTATARNAAASFGEALPFVGVAVIAGATAWEVADACALIKELHDLDVAFNPENTINDREVCGMQAPTTEELWTMIRNSPGEAWENAGDIVSGLPEFSFSGTYQTLIAGGDWLYEWMTGGGDPSLEDAEE